MPDNAIHPGRIDLTQLNEQQLRELRDAVALRLAATGGWGGSFESAPAFAYGEPAASFAYGAPAPSFAYGAPAASFAYGAPTASFAYGAPTASFAYGAPTASFAYGAPTASFAYGAPAPGSIQVVPMRDPEMSALLLQRWDAALQTVNLGFRRLAVGVLGGAATLASAGLIGSRAGWAATGAAVAAALFFDLWFLVEMLRGGRGDEV